MSDENVSDLSALNAVSSEDLQGAKILLVDDNLQNLELIQAYLEGMPVEISTAVDGVEAIESIEANQPDLVLLDVMMPLLMLIYIII